MDDDDEINAARQQWLEWVERNDRALDAIVDRLAFFEDLLYRDPPELNWDQLLAERNQIDNRRSEVEIILQHIDMGREAIESLDDALRSRTREFEHRAKRVLERIDELAFEFVRMLGEVGRAHDRRALDVKRQPPGAHGVYR